MSFFGPNMTRVIQRAGALGLYSDHETPMQFAQKMDRHTGVITREDEDIEVCAERWLAALDRLDSASGRGAGVSEKQSTEINRHGGS